MHIVIIGNGIAGSSWARHVRKLSDHKITVISSETEYFWSRTALMYIYMGHMKHKHTQPYENWFWKKNKIDLLFTHVDKIDSSSKQLSCSDGSTLSYDKLVLATGSKPNKFGWPGQDLKGVGGMVSKQDLDTIEEYSKGLERAVIVGGGLIGIEMAEMFHSRHIPATLLVRESSFWNGVMPPEESEMINQEIFQTHGIDLRLKTELKEILPDENGKVRAVITNEGEEIPCGFVGLTAGVHANISLAESAGIETNRAFLVDEYLQTSIPDIYATGDCAELRNPLAGRRAIEAVWYTGKQMGPILAKTLCGEPTPYRQNFWFNSAKFFDIEYQTYGWVWSQLKEDEAEFYWEHKSGKKCMHFIFDKNSKIFLGVNTFGIRLRHECFDQWLTEKRDIFYILEHLRQANFDPEFFDRHEKEIADAFNKVHPERQIQLKGKKSILESIFR